MLPFETNPLKCAVPVWIENPTDKELTWRIAGEFVTFKPGYLADYSVGNEPVCMDMHIAMHFKNSLPDLIVHIGSKDGPVFGAVESEPKSLLEEAIDANIEAETTQNDKAPEDMNMAELRAYLKGQGIKAPFQAKKDDLLALVTKSKEEIAG